MPAGRLLAQSPATRTFNPQEPIPFDGAVVRGSLPNGLQFFIRQNARPAKRVLLRLAVKAVRAGLASRVRTELPALEAIYLNELMTTRDATEGLQAFLDKRSPAWRHE